MLNPHLWVERCSPLYGSLGSLFLTLVVEIVALGFASMIYFPFSIFGLDLEYSFDSKAFISATSDYFVWHSSMLWEGLLWNSHHFHASFFIFLLLLIYCGFDGLSWVISPWLWPLFCGLEVLFPFFRFINPKSHLFYLTFCVILIEFWYITPSEDISRNSIFGWMCLCKNAWYLSTRCFLESLIPNFVRRV